MSKVSTYLNFPKKTEEAFKFYKSIFKTEFGSNGIIYFGDMPKNPKIPLPEEQKKLVMHVELPITGGHLLMGTDAPEPMGFKITFGNNVYINLEPDTREETKRLYNALSAGGKAIMPLDDMIWGAYFGSCRDKYGINWMFNYDKNQNK
jgi:PhnB protein